VIVLLPQICVICLSVTGWAELSESTIVSQLFIAVMIFLLAFNVCVNSDKDAGSCNAVEMQPRSTERSSS